MRDRNFCVHQVIITGERYVYFDGMGSPHSSFEHEFERDSGPSTSTVNPVRNVFAASNDATGASTKRSFEQAFPKGFQPGMYIFCWIDVKKDRGEDKVK